MFGINTMTFEIIIYLYGITFIIYFLSFLFFVYNFLFAKEKVLKLAMLFLSLGLIPHSLAILIMWFITGHGPYLTKHEVISSNVWLIIFGFLFLSNRYPEIKRAGLIVSAVCLILMMFVFLTTPKIVRISPTLKSFWLIFHVLSNDLAVVTIVLALAFSVLYILKERNEGKRHFYKKLPPLPVLDEYVYRFMSLTFVFWTIMIVTGSMWANQAWGSYWSWDPVEVWSLITWLLLGLYLHLRHFLRLRGRRSVYFVILCFIISFITLFFIPFFVESLHSVYFQ
jgi:cytochrome c-type biogenesis protein CcsB